MTPPRNFYDIYPITSFLLLFILAFFGLEFIGQTKLDEGVGPLVGINGKLLWEMGALFPPAVNAGEYWRLLSCVFLHGGLIHLFFNAYVLFDVGRICEPLLSPWKYLVVFVMSGLGSSLAVLFISSRGAVGASGALCGLIGLLFAYATRHGKQEMRDALLRWIILIAVLGFLIPRVSWEGHLGGFVVGCVFGWFTKEYTTSDEARRWAYPGYVCAGLTVVCLGMALWNYFVDAPQ